MECDSELKSMQNPCNPQITQLLLNISEIFKNLQLESPEKKILLNCQFSLPKANCFIFFQNWNAGLCPNLLEKYPLGHFWDF